MSKEISEFREKARRARDKLVKQFLNHPDVSLIDIGYSTDSNTKTEGVVLRIHVRERWLKALPEERVAFPDQVDSIPVVVIPGDYQLENDVSVTGE